MKNLYLSIVLLIFAQNFLISQCTGAVESTGFNSMYTGSEVGQRWVADCNGNITSIQIQSNAPVATIGNISLRIWEEVPGTGTQVIYIQNAITISGFATPTTISVSGGIGTTEIDMAKTYYFELTQNDGTSLDLHYNSVGNHASGWAVDGNLAPIDINMLSDLTFSVSATISLPVEMTFFNLRKSKSGILLDWQTASETNNEGFIILKSDNGVDWDPIGFEKGAGTTSEVQNYRFEDSEPFPGMNFYKIRQQDFDGNFEDSKVHSLRFVGATSAALLFPNPVEDVLNIQFEKEGARSIECRNSTGQLLFAQFLLNKFNSEISLKEYGITSGVYWITIRDIDSGQILENRKISLI